jgi:hypothetical protein
MTNSARSSAQAEPVVALSKLRELLCDGGKYWSILNWNSNVGDAIRDASFVPAAGVKEVPRG